MPHLVSEVTAKEATNLFHPWFSTVERTARGEVVGLAAYPELLVGDEGLGWIYL